jgi:hypothetical protein
MAKRVQVVEEFPIGKNIYKAGTIHTFSDELAQKYSNFLTQEIVQEVTEKVETKKINKAKE